MLLFANKSRAKIIQAENYCFCELLAEVSLTLLFLLQRSYFNRSGQHQIKLWANIILQKFHIHPFMGWFSKVIIDYMNFSTCVRPQMLYWYDDAALLTWFFKLSKEISKQGRISSSFKLFTLFEQVPKQPSNLYLYLYKC